MRTTLRRHRFAAAAILAVSFTGFAFAASRAQAEPAAEEVSEPKGAEAPRPEGAAPAPPPAVPGAGREVAMLPLYVPPSLGSPERRVGAGTRGVGRFASLLLLAPDHIAYTSQEQPTLYWYLAQETTTRIDVTLRDESSVKPLLEVQVPLPAAAGVHAVRLADHGVRLRPDTNYLWFVSLVPEPEQRSKDFSMGAWIRRRAPAPTARDAQAYARAGLWYEAIDTASAQIAAAPGDAARRELRARLLEQAGLSEVAAYDRAP